MIVTLTGSPTVTTPISLTTLGCQNCPLMAASCKNLTLSCSEEPSFSTFTATSLDPPERSHTPFITVPNCPDPSWSLTLHNTHVRWLPPCTLRCDDDYEYVKCIRKICGGYTLQYYFLSQLQPTTIMRCLCEIPIQYVATWLVDSIRVVTLCVFLVNLQLSSFTC